MKVHEEKEGGYSSDYHVWLLVKRIIQGKHVKADTYIVIFVGEVIQDFRCMKPEILMLHSIFSSLYLPRCFSDQV